MRNHPLLLIVLSSMALTACVSEDGSASDPLGQCTLCDDSSGGDDDGAGGSAAVELVADMDVEVTGAGTFVGVDPACGVATSGDFHASLSGTATYHDDDGTDATGSLWTVVDVSDDASIETDTGCSCSGLTIEAMARADVRATLDATTESCALACDASAASSADATCGSDAGCRASAEAEAHASCMLSCDLDGNMLVATTTLSADAMASISLDGDADFDALENASLDLTFDQVLHADGSVTDL